MSDRRDKQGKFSKQERRMLKKHTRSTHRIAKDENIIIYTAPTCHLLVGNGGLANGIKQQEVESVFRKYGVVVDIVMKPMKSYCFVSMGSIRDAKCAVDSLNGKLLKCPDEIGVSGVRFYLSFIENVPGNEVPSMMLPPGLKLVEDFVTEKEEMELLECITWNVVDKKISQGARENMKHRRVKHYGYEFLYGINNIDINCPLEEGIPSECVRILSRMEQQNIISFMPDQLTVNQYQPGQGIPPHIDTHSACEDGIISLSLGSQVVMEFRHPDGRHFPVLLPRRSLLVMTGESRYVWSHGITPRKSDIVLLSQVSKNTSERHERTGQPSSQDNDVICASESASSLEKCVQQFSVTNCNSSVPETGILEINKNMNDRLNLQKGGDTKMEITACENKDVNEGAIVGSSCSGCVRECEPMMKDSLTLIDRRVRTSFTFRKVLAGPCKCAFPAQCDSQKHQPSEFKSETSTQEQEDDKPVLPVSEKDAEKLEAELVHQVYEEIAGHFSDTRHSPWPRVVEFLQSQPPGSLILDIGCGNGKYLSANHKAYKIGCDRSENLCLISAERGFPVFVCDCLAVPVRSNSVDAVISIAVIHHLSTVERRRQAVQQVVQALRPGGQALIYVWALEQELNKKKSKYLKESYKETMCGENSQAAVDRKVSDSEEMKTKPASCTDSGEAQNTNVDQAEQKRYLSVHVNRTAFQSQDLLVPWHLKDKSKHKAGDETADRKLCKDITSGQIFHRYYHVFKQGELEELCESVDGISILSSYYDQGNWCVIFTKS